MVVSLQEMVDEGLHSCHEKEMDKTRVPMLRLGER